MQPIIQSGHVTALFAFDIGYEVNLDDLRALLTTTPVQPLSRKKLTPAYLQYSKPPQVLNLGPAPELDGRAGNIQATIFGFGAVSIAFRWPLTLEGEPCDLGRLPRLGQDLYARNLETHARQKVEGLLSGMRAAVAKPVFSNLVEDYFIFVIEKFTASLAAEELLQQHGQVLAEILRFESKALSRDMQDEALSHRLSYYTDDLVLLDWNSAIIYDAEYEDTLNVLELLNVELLEARYMDGQLDSRLETYARLIRRPTPWPLPLRNPYRKAIAELTETRIETSLLAERSENALKLIGNLYLARLHAMAAKRFYLQEWQQQISQKLDIASGFYQLLNDRVQTAQSHTLELIVIILIFVEVVLGFARQ